MKILIIVYFCLSLQVFAEKITGAISRDANQNFIIRTAEENITLNRLSTTDDKHRVLVKAFLTNLENPRIEEFNIPDEFISSRERIPFGTRGDCGELPISADDLINIVEEGPENMSMIDFLQAIPDGTLESFTLITNTRSLQRGENGHLVDEQNPRVLRQTMDGKLTISFVCHEDQDKHNSVEIIYFDDDEQRFKTLSFDFDSPQGRGEGAAGEGKRIHEDPQSCIACHATSEKNGVPGSEHLKLNWPQYFFWGDCNIRRGVTMYGMSDDNMGRDEFRARRSSVSQNDCSNGSDLRAHQELSDEFVKLRQRASSDPCLSTLPWAQAPKKNEPRVGIEQAWSDNDYQFYPYGDRAQARRNDPTSGPTNRSDIQNYSLRTNLRFTDVYGRLTGIRNSRLIRDNPNYENIKYYLAMEGIPNCMNNQERNRVASELGLSLSARSQGGTDPNTYPLMKAFADQIVGFETQDWAMHVPEAFAQTDAERSPAYNAAIVSDNPRRDQQIHDLTMGDIIQRVGDEVGGVAQQNSRDIMARGIEETFGSRFSCIDDAGVGISRAMDGDQQRAASNLCSSLRTLAEARGPLAPITSAEISSECRDPNEPVQLQIPQEMLNQIITQRERQGQELVGNCVGCHSGDHELGFITDEPSLTGATEVERLTQYSSDPLFWQKVEGHLSGALEPRMPFGCDGDDCMNPTQSGAIIAYLRALVSDDYQNITESIIGESVVTSCDNVDTSTLVEELEVEEVETEEAGETQVQQQ